ncbi:hypothetical protein M5K25_006834 [Dendrobium thyrsiflorum]|uniref:Uncharacterized protein n=1 Tax=Dendrobium thyrsiflorum TaxID=117978 RepID=A0ABD0VJD7_DENTH
MSSGSSEPCDDDDDDNILCGVDEVNVDMNTEINSIIQRYYYVNVGTAKGKVANNDFVKTYLSTHEWDKDVTNDNDSIGYQVEEEFSIPTELMEGTMILIILDDPDRLGRFTVIMPKLFLSSSSLLCLLAFIFLHLLSFYEFLEFVGFGYPNEKKLNPEGV